MSEEKNAYDYLSGPQIANELEKTQINKFHTKGGTGFAAEDANALHDRLSGHDVQTVGRSNELNGADRIVDGVAIQTKYFPSAQATINAAFDSEGIYRYGTQLLEVPSDQYDASLELMRQRIEQGNVPGVTDPNQAQKIIKRGDVTYQQAKNIAKAGNIDSLTFDAQNQCVTCGYAFAISFAINFAKMTWNGQHPEMAMKEAIGLGLQSGATSFIVGIVTSQILRTEAAAWGAVVVRDGVKTAARTSLGKSAIEKIAQASLGKAVYGAAATSHVAKLLRTNTITAVVTTVVISTPDVYRVMISKRISWTQFIKNFTINTVGVAGGAGGWLAGAAGGAALGSVVPGVGTAIGGVVGGLAGALLGGVGATKVSKFIMDGLIEDDAKEMLRLLTEEYLPALASDYLLSEDEVDTFMCALEGKINQHFLRDMYQNADRKALVYSAFEPLCEEIIRHRPQVTLPSAAEVQSHLCAIEEEIIDVQDADLVG